MKNKKILIAGVGGQGIVYITGILAEAGIISDIPVSVSEIHGLSQRGGIVTAGIGVGKYCTGFLADADVDFLIGLEPLEAQRCIAFLHQDSCVIMGDTQIAPYSVNAEQSKYPEIDSYASFLNDNIKKTVYVKDFPAEISTVLRNLFLLGISSAMPEFPFNPKVLEKAIERTVIEYNRERSLMAFRLGVKYMADREKHEKKVNSKKKLKVSSH